MKEKEFKCVVYNYEDKRYFYGKWKPTRREAVINALQGKFKAHNISMITSSDSASVFEIHGIRNGKFEFSEILSKAVRITILASSGDSVIYYDKNFKP